MAHTFTNLMYHTVFSTKRRRPLLEAEVMPRVIEYVGGILRNRGATLLAMGGAPDHVHLLTVLPAAQALSTVMRDIKSASSGWIRQTFPPLSTFAWQGGYAAFTVSKSSAPEVTSYIERQEKHHHETSFEEEFVAFLDRHNIDYDPKFVFD